MKQIICEKCRKHPATVYYKETVNGKEKEMHLCHDCAQQEGVGEWLQKPFFAGDLFTPFSLLQDPFFHALPQKSAAACPVCGTTARRIRESGKFGCSSCYDVFRDLFDFTPFIGTGYTAGHLSDAPAPPSQKSAAAEKKEEEKSVKAKIEERRRLLKEAIREENYERCAVLRDEIRALEGK